MPSHFSTTQTPPLAVQESGLRHFAAVTHRLIFSDDRTRHLRIRSTLLACAAYAACVLAVAIGCWLGQLEREALIAVSIYDSGIIAFLIAVRLGWDDKLGMPGLLVAQMTYAFVSLGLAYVVLPPVQAMMTLVVSLVLMFGAFSATPRQCRMLGVLAVVIFGIAMACDVYLDPNANPRLAFIHFLFLAIVYPVMGMVASVNSAIRYKSRKQQTELREALSRIQHLATCDELTGLPNRRHAVETIGLAVARAQRYQTPLCLGVIDLDHFKRVNDTYGHAAGDRVLRHVAQLTQPLLRSSDMLARWGGEEFILLLPETELKAAIKVMKRLQADMAKQRPDAALPDLAVTFSAGLVSLAHGETVGRAIERADQLLYKAKACGRNRVMIE